MSSTASEDDGGRRTSSAARYSSPIVVTQLPAGDGLERRNRHPLNMLRAWYGEGARIIAIRPDQSIRVLTPTFHSACDPEISFDAAQIVFAGKREASDDWNIYEMRIDGAGVRRITSNMGDCRSPMYQSTLYTLESPEPWRQLTFVSDAAGEMNEDGSAAATHLYSCRLDGSEVRRLTYNLSSDFDPFLMWDGRLLYAGWQRSSLARGVRGRVSLFGVNIDGADIALFADSSGSRVKHMPCVTDKGLVVFVETDRSPWDGGGRLACVAMRRPLHSYRPITRDADGLFHSPSPLPGGAILASRRPRRAPGTHEICRVDPRSGVWQRVYDDPNYHDIQAKLVRPRQLPDGRSSVVTEDDPHGKLYCLNVYLSDFDNRDWMPAGEVKRLRVLEGIPLAASNDGDCGVKRGAPSDVRPGSSYHGLPPLAQRRILGEIDIAEDGSFQIETPANTPLELQTLDRDGMALRTCSWIWVKNHEPRGCVGCHEDGELTPENVFVSAAARPSVRLCLPPPQRRTVDFRRDVMPLIDGKCVACHGQDGASPRLDGGLDPVVRRGGGPAEFNRAYESLLALDESADENALRWKYVRPGSARASPLIWHLFGRNTSRPWDGDAVRGRVVKIPPGDKAPPLTDNEKRTFVEWIDMGAMWNGIPEGR